MQTYDFVIIGSGVSGGRMAYELTASGAKCLLLEAGREFSATTFPAHEIDYSTQMFWGGGLEISTDGNLGFLRARCLGGTSIVNQALLDRFDDVAWDDWRHRSGVSYFNKTDMEASYQAIEAKVKISEIPRSQYNRNAQTFTKACEHLGYEWKKLKRAQGECALDKGSDCIVCLGGCPRDSKQSSLVTTIRWAREKGLRVESEFEVHHLSDAGDKVHVYGRQRGAETEVVGRRVVLAAGAMGNTAILLRSGYQKELPALGHGFACHPQYMTYAMFDEPIDAHKGAFQAVASQDPRMRKQGFKLENVYAPPIGTAMLMPGFGPNHQRLMRKYRFYASMEVAVRDEPTGVIRVTRGDKLVVDKQLTAQDQDRTERGLKLVSELFHAAGASEIVSCTQAFGLHLMGGCSIGVDARKAVVSPDFRVFGHRNLIAADSSIFPEAPGINPSFTIMALSHRAAREVLSS
ncbi:MAG: GMC family oxidoreductase [Deltaproteobacteria bacterium]|nr:GMC family oxidoreductase [Deltaproteobacteria bacterium]